MAETAMKFGPEWLRALSHGNSVPSPVSNEISIPRYKLAQYRYGREEMLALFTKDLKIPEELSEFDFLVTEKCQLPLALLPVTDDEQRIWSRSVNSDVALRGPGKPANGPGNGIIRTGRGGSVDRGRGRGGRGGYYQRGVTFDDNEDGPPGGFTRLRTLERSQSANEKDQRWDERDRRFERPFAGRSGLLEDSSSSGNLTKQESLRPPSDNWRRSEKDDDGGWRTAGTRGMDKFGGRNTWRGATDRDRIRPDFDGKDKTQPNRDVVQNGPGKNHSRQRTNSGHFWENDAGGDNLPEWSVEESTVSEAVGTFDSSGAFMESKLSEAVCNSNEIYTSDDEDCVKKKEAISKGWSDDWSSEDLQSKQKAPEKIQQKNGNEDSPCKKPSTKLKDHDKKTLRSKQSSEPKVSHSPVKERTFEKKPVQNSSKVLHVDKQNEPANRITDVTPQTVMSGINLKPECSVPVDVQMKPVVSEPSTIIDELPIPTEEDAFAHHKKATESMMARWTEEEEQIDTKKTVEKTNILPVLHENAQKWFYRDPQSDIQGPFNSAEMYDWFKAGYFSMDLLVRRACDERFVQLGELIQSWGRVPFIPGTSPPPQPVQAAPVQTPAMAPTITQPGAAAAPAPTTQPTTSLIQPDTQLRLMHQQFFQQIVQQQLFYRQSHIEQLINYLKQQESFAKLSPQQQSQAVTQLLAQMQQMHGRSQVGSLPEQPVMDGVPPVPFPMMGLTMPSLPKGEMPMWNIPPATGTWPLGQSSAQPTATSIWDTDTPNSMPIEVSELEKKMAAEEDEKRRLVMEVMKKHEEDRRRQEEDRKRQEEDRKRQEEAERLFKKMQQRFEEEEKRKLEEMQRLKEEEQRRQEELRLLEERRKEDERRMEELRKEELRRKQEEEERKKQMELEELRRLDAERKKAELEEQRKQQELKLMEELRQKDEELKRIEELRRQKKKAEQERIQELKRQESDRLKELEMQSQLEAEKQKEFQRREYEKQQLELQRKETERQLELQQRKEAENQEPKGPVWCMVNKDWPSEDMSLASIQKLQEKNDKEEKERLRLQQIQQQKLLLQQQNMKQIQANKNGLSWAKRSTEPTNTVKSLIEIQQEEAQRLAQQQQQQQQLLQQQQKAQKTVATTVNEVAGVWGNSSQLSRVTSGSAWSAGNTAGFWDDPVKSVTVQKPTKNSDSAFPALNNAAKPANVNSNKNKNVRAKKDEDAVLKIFEAHRKPTDEFTTWCTEALSNMPSSVDVPTFVAFLKDVESPFEVSDYVKSYLGEGKEAHEFGKQFLERRSKFRNQAKQTSVEENMWGPAPAITPSAKPPNVNDCDATTCTKGKTKKKRNKMQKMDSSMLGFTVQPNPDRINVGEIDRVEGM